MLSAQSCKGLLPGKFNGLNSWKTGAGAPRKAVCPAREILAAAVLWPTFWRHEMAFRNNDADHSDADRRQLTPRLW